MKVSDLSKAADLARQLEEVESAMDRVQSARCFKLEMKPATNMGQYEFVGHCEGVSPGSSGSYGDLAIDLKEAAVRYYTTHKGILEAELKQLGVAL